MTKSLILLLLVLPPLILAGCAAPDQTPAPLPTDAAAPDPGVSAVTEATVTIANMAFQPHTLVVATGARVTWYNNGEVAHTVTSGEGWFDSGQLAAGESYNHQFDQPGTFRLGCTNHPQNGGSGCCAAWRCGGSLPF